jgi:hypothetical protein
MYMYSRFSVTRFATLGTICATIFLIFGLHADRSEARQVPEEITVGTEEQLASNPNLTEFFAQTRLAFLGTFEGFFATFLPGDRRTEIFTALTFKPVEFLKGRSRPDPSTPALTVWQYGGTYVVTPSGPKVVRPAPITERLASGSLYFVAVGTLDDHPGLTGKYVLRGRDTIVRLDDKEAVALSSNQGWVRAVVAQGRSSMTRPGPSPDDATAFLIAIRRAVTQSHGLK